MTTRDEDAVVAAMNWRGAIRSLYALRDAMRTTERLLRKRHPEAWTPVVCAAASRAYTGAFRDLDVCLRAVERDLGLIDEPTADRLADLAAARETDAERLRTRDAATG